MVVVNWGKAGERSEAKRETRATMTISEICIKRPVFTWVLVAMPVVLGVVSYFNLGVDLFPSVDFPVASVTTVLERGERGGDGDLGHEADRGHHQHDLGD